MMTELHFREIRNGVALSHTDSPVVVDIACNQDMFEMLDKDEKVEETETLICVHWEHVPDATYVLSSMTLTRGSQEELDLQHEVAKSLVRNTSMLQQFLSDLFKSFDAKLVAVKYTPLQFILQHNDRESMGSMARNSAVLQAIFKEMMSSCCNTLPPVQLRMKIFNSSLPPCADLKRECFLQADHAFPTDSMYIPYQQSMGRAVSTDTILQDIEGEENQESIGNRFVSLEHEMTEQRRIIEAHAREQREQTYEIREALSMITQRIRGDSEKDAPQVTVGQLVSVSDKTKPSEHSSVETSSLIKGLTKEPDIKKETITTKPQSHVELESSAAYPTDEVKTPTSDGVIYFPVKKESSENQSNTVQPFVGVEEGITKRGTPQHDPEITDPSDSCLTEEQIQGKPDRRELDVPKDPNEIRRSGSAGDKPVLGEGGKMMEVLAEIKSALVKHYEVGKVWGCVEKTLEEDGSPYPKARGVMNTVLCLDTSSSIGEEGLEDMKRLLEAFIDDIEESAEDLEQEENIAVVAFGGGASTLHPISNDYGSVRDAIEDIQLGGSSPLLQGLLVSVAALALGQGGSGSETSQLSRIIVMTDGLVTGERTPSDTDTKTTWLSQQDKNRFMSTLRILRPKETPCKVIDAMVWIPVGDANSTFLQDLVSWSNGNLLNGKEIKSLCRHQGHQRDPGSSAPPVSSLGRVQPTGRTPDTTAASQQDTAIHSDGRGVENKDTPSPPPHQDNQVNRNDVGNSSPSLSSLGRAQRAGETLHAIAAEKRDPGNSEPVPVSSFGGARRTERISDTKDMDKHGSTSSLDVGARRSERKATDVFDNVYESEGLPILGSRVMRGVDWKWDDQDMGGPGTITNHGAEGKSVWVAWDHGECNRYRYGLGGYFDLKVVDDQPRSPRRDGRIQIGMLVERGADWQQTDDDGGPSCSGTVIRRQSDTVMVKWKTGNIGVYRYGEGGKFDVCVRDPVSCLMERTTNQKRVQHDKQRTAPTDGVPKHKKPSDRHKENSVWQWLDGDGVWTTYSDENNLLLSRAYENQKSGHCSIEKDGKRFLVLFQNFVEKSLTDRCTRKVRKCPID
ncbi:uncharacterized protein LOC124263163 isoform X2 [Haliotis rubra]|uniref:uncharacterized protein LOC124263163 isoform X2 n=1 Tax=Haliotis rubra TaxID=36100 RepID=UPI001EE585C5|nr:uncharacterized protein LOC124263163 isoform X2 [Haliotis rubra]